MSRQSKNQKEGHNPLLQDTRRQGSGMSAAPGWNPPVDLPLQQEEGGTQEQEPVESPQVVQSPVTFIRTAAVSSPTSSLNLPPAGAVHRATNRKVTFPEQYMTISISVDRRIAPYVKDLLTKGATKTEIANQILLKILLEAGYPIDPSILTQPYIKPE